MPGARAAASTPFDGRTPLRALAQRRDLPAALREAAAAFLDRGARPDTDLATAAQARDLPSLLTALLALDGEVERSDAWEPIDKWLARRAGTEPATAPRLRVRASGAEPRLVSAYRERVCGGILVGVAAAIWTQSSAGPITRAQVALSGAGPMPIRARQTEATLHGRRPSAALVEVAAETARQEAQPAGAGWAVDAGVLAAVRDVSRVALSAILGA